MLFARSTGNAYRSIAGTTVRMTAFTITFQPAFMFTGELCPKSRFGWLWGLWLVRVVLWIVPFVERNKDDPRSHTNHHEPKYFRLELDLTFEARFTGAGPPRVSQQPSIHRPRTVSHILDSSSIIPPTPKIPRPFEFLLFRSRLGSLCQLNVQTKDEMMPEMICPTIYRA